MLSRCRHWLSGLLVALAPLAAVAALPPSVAQVLKFAGIPEKNVSVVIRPVDGGKPLISHNATQPMNPASVMKLLTTYSALEILGPSHTWQTDVLADHDPDEAGVLKGNLYLRGSGDPKLALEQFWLLLRELRRAGVRDIEGDLVLDRSAFALPPHNRAAFDQKPLRPYNVGPDALLTNFQSLRFGLVAEPAHGVVRVVQETPDERIRVDNQLELTADDCGDWRESLKTKVEGFRLELSGTFAADCVEKALNLAPFDADMHVEGLFRTLWRELGGHLRGEVRSGRVPPLAKRLLSHESPPLSEIARDTNKFSNNVMAQQVLLALSPTRPATPEGARKHLRQWLANKKLDFPELVIENGSGLSRRERISAESMSRLLAAAWASPIMPEFVASLAVLGRDGTVRKQLSDGAAAGRAHLKTGYLEEVRSIAGYVQDTTGRRWILVAMINDPQAAAGKPVFEALIRHLFVAEEEL